MFREEEKDALRENHHLRKLKFYNVAEVLARQKGGGGQLRETVKEPVAHKADDHSP